jgi:hypothetical protein
LAVSITVYILAAASPPLSEPANNQFFLPIAMALKARSAALLSISTLPSSKNLLRAISLDLFRNSLIYLQIMYSSNQIKSKMESFSSISISI